MKRLYEYKPDTWYDKDKLNRAHLGDGEYYFDGTRVGSIEYAHSLVDMIHNNGFNEITAESLLALPSELIINMSNFPEDNMIIRACRDKSRINTSAPFTTGVMLEQAEYFEQLAEDVQLLSEIKEHMLSNNRNYYIHDVNTVDTPTNLDNLNNLRYTELHYLNPDTGQSAKYQVENSSITRTSRIPDDIFMKMSGFEKGDDRLTYDRYEIYKEFPAYKETLKKEQSENSDKVTKKESYEQLNLFDYDDLSDENTITK